MIPASECKVYFASCVKGITPSDPLIDYAINANLCR